MKCIRAVLWFAIVSSFVLPAEAFIIDSTTTPWRRTASGRRSGNGDSGTLTWSIVPDGTRVSDGNESLGGSDLLGFLNDNFDGDPVEADHTQQPWFPILEASFQRWDDLSGLTFQYEPNDDGGDSRSRRGALGVRGDIRLSGASIDGRGSVLAFNFLPEAGGDMTIDTDDVGFANSSNNFRFFRNTVMHELGHAFGLSHVTSSTDNLLMEPSANSVIDGPQLDEVRAIQFFFGDALEADNDGAGNETIELATDLGLLKFGDAIDVGSDGNRASQRISSRRTDFVSVSNDEDLDVYSFTVEDYASLSAELTPLGGTFSQAGQGGLPTEFDADARSPLTLTVFDSSGEDVLDQIDLELGEAGLLTDIALEPGTYYAQIQGGEDTIQLYMLDLELSSLAGDYNFDGIVDAADFTVWRNSLNSTRSIDLAADGDGSGRIDQADYQLWLDNFGVSYINHPAEVAAIPESNAMSILGIGLLILSHVRTSRRRGRPLPAES